MGTAASWFAALTDVGGRVQSQVRVQPQTLFSGQTGTTAVPTDAAPPPTSIPTVGNGSTADLLGNWTPPLGSIRCDGYKQIALTLELFESSGTGSATFQPYFFDGFRWVACADSITITTSSVTTSSPAARQRHDIVVENDFGFCLVITAISGTGATAAAYATLRDMILQQK